MIGIARASSTYDLLATWRSQTSDLQNQLNKASLEVATGLKADVYKSLGFHSSEVLALRMQLNRNDEIISSNEFLANKLDFTSLTLEGIRDITQDFLGIATSNANVPTTSAKGLQEAALAAFEQLVGQLNSTFQNTALFSGIDSSQTSLQKWEGVNASTGLSPSDVLASVVGSGLTDATDAAQKVSLIQDIFKSSDTVSPNRNFEATFYNGSPLLQPGGSATPRLQSQIDKNTTLSYGIQANDPAFTEILRGLSMIATMDVSKIPDGEAYEVWMGNAVSALSNGVTGLITVEANLGSQQKSLDERISAQKNLGDVFNSRISGLEGVDLYEASSRILLLETQLQATYTVTSRLSKLTFLNFL